MKYYVMRENKPVIDFGTRKECEQFISIAKRYQESPVSYTIVPENK